MKPILLTLDDDPDVLIAFEHDLKQRYGNRFRIHQSNSGQKGLDLVNQLKLRNELVAIFVVEQRIPEMMGIEFLQHTMDVFPDAKCILLTKLGDTEAI
jgi:thioredoxin reductase (NADPH)